MKHKQCKIFSFLAVIFYSLNLYALAPVESLVLGNMSEQYSENETDPLFYVFKHSSNLKPEDVKGLRRELAVYRGFYEEGKNLDKFCKNPGKIDYVSPLEVTQIKRSIMATLQYIALDLTTRAIPQYAKYFEFSRDEYANLVNGLVGNYCSINLSVISKKELKNNLFLKFDKENTFALPSVDSNPLFPKALKTIIPERFARENEFKYTIKVFQHMCSWGGDPRNAGLLIPFLKDANLMAFIFRQMASKSIDWNDYKNEVMLKEDSQTQPVWCDGLICRKSTKENFEQHVYHALGSSDVYDDFRKLYCEEMQDIYFTPKDSDPKLAKIMNSLTLDEENFLNSQLIALITGIPDFLLGVPTLNKGEDVLRASIDQIMQEWALKSVNGFSKELLFEEPLTLELVERKQYFDKVSPELKVAFDVNLGEFDRINQTIGKVKMTFEINILKSYLRYYRQAVLDLDPRDHAEKNRLTAQFKVQITQAVQDAKEKLIIPPWKGDLEAILVNEIAEQLIAKQGDVLHLSDKGFQKIIIEINYAPFALKYINHQFSMLKGSTEQNK